MHAVFHDSSETHCSKLWETISPLFSVSVFAICFNVLFILLSPGGLGADPVECVSSTGHHQPGAECHDLAYCWQPCSQLSGTAAPQQEPQSPGNKVAAQLFSVYAVVVPGICMQQYYDCVYAQVWKETCSDQGRSGERNSGSCVKERQCPYTPPVPRLGPCALVVCSISW